MASRDNSGRIDEDHDIQQYRVVVQCVVCYQRIVTCWKEKRRCSLTCAAAYGQRIHTVFNVKSMMNDLRILIIEVFVSRFWIAV